MSFTGPNSRRRFLASTLAMSALPRAVLGQDGLIIRSQRPLDAETPVEVFAQDLTPNDRFFIRSHLGIPTVVTAPWRIEVGGLAKSPRFHSLDDLPHFPESSVTAVLQCSGNGRAYFQPNIPGVAWDRGAVGNARWTGVRLRDLLEQAGIDKGAKQVHFLGADLPPHPKTPVYLRSLPLEKALADEVILATRMNDQPLPVPQGGPVRLVVPGWTGNHWMKWVRRITLAAELADGFYMQTAYRIARKPYPPGVDVPPEDLDFVTTLNVKSLIVSPATEAVLRQGRQEVSGVAWTGPGRVTKVDVAIDDGPWRAAELVGPDREFAWRRWRLAWDATAPGRYSVRARATDSRGDVQPETTPWNRSGYLWNGIDRVTCEVRAS
jgi:DMSO/TMAO reductase YedYZ molybdopterin-dependent catalytic subunit